MRDLEIPACLDEIYDALQNIIALPVPYQDRFRKNDSVFRFEKSNETGSKSDPQNSSKSSRILNKFGRTFDTSGEAKSFKRVVNSSKIAWSPVLKKWSKWVPFWGRFGGQNRCFTVF